MSDKDSAKAFHAVAEKQAAEIEELKADRDIWEGNYTDRTADFLSIGRKSEKQAEEIDKLTQELSGLGGPRGAQFKRVETQQEEIEKLKTTERLWRHDFPMDWEVTHKRLVAERDRLRAALELVAMPKRPDGTYNRGREACEQVATEALTGGKHEG